MANWLDRLIVALSPELGLRRVRAKRQAEALMNYDAARMGRRLKSLRPNALDADGASDQRRRVSFVARDMLRNNPIALRAQAVVTASVVGDGIIPALVGASDRTRRRFEALVKAHLDTTAIDADGRCNLYGLQRLAMNAVFADGEVLIRIRRRTTADGLALPFQLQLLEADYIDESRDSLGGTVDGVTIRQGIEYDRRGRRLAYWLFDDHPGSMRLNSARSRRVPASEVIHIYRQDRPGQQRGVSWLAPVAMQLQDLADYLDAQIVRQKIAACMAGFRVTQNGEPDETGDPLATLKPGAVYTLAPGEDIRFSDPPQVTGLSEFTTASLRAIAGGVGITYEALTGDLGGVNYSSGRLGRMEMDRNVSAWQWLMLIPQMMDPIGRLILDTWAAMPGVTDNLRGAQVIWTPPARIIVDPGKEYAAMQQAVRAGFRSWSDVVRSLGYDPEDVAAEMAADAERFDRLGLTLDSDPRFAASGGGLKAAAPAPDAQQDGEVNGSGD